MLFEFFDFIFSPVMLFGNFVSITLISLFLSFVLVVIYKFTTNQNVMRDLKSQIEFYKKKSDEAQKANDTKTMNENIGKMMELNKKYFSLSTKSLLFSSVVFLLLMPWIGGRFGSLQISMPFTVPLVGSSLEWFGWYFIIVIPSSVIFRKILDIEM